MACPYYSYAQPLMFTGVVYKLTATLAPLAPQGLPGQLVKQEQQAQSVQLAHKALLEPLAQSPEPTLTLHRFKPPFL